MARSFVQVCAGTQAFRDEQGRKHVLHAWQQRPELRAAQPQDVNAAFVAEVRKLIRRVEELTDRYLARRGKERTP